MNERRARMIAELSDVEYRESYADHHLNSVLASQIRTIREQRGLTQTRLATRIGKQQAAISRIENVNYARWNIRTLKNVAAALGCWLDIRLESWGKLVEAVDEYSTESLRRERFEDDPVFWGSVAKGPVPEPVRWVQQRLLPWLERWGNAEPMLTEWLQGRGLPPVGDQDPPHVWVARAIHAEGPESKHLGLLNGWLAKHIPMAVEAAGDTNDPDAFLSGLFGLAATFCAPEVFAGPLRSLYTRLKAAPDLLSETAKASFLTAMIRNQEGYDLKHEWLRTIEEGSHEVLPANEWDAFEALKWIPARPNLRAIAEGLKAMQIAAWRRPESEIDIILVIRDVQNTFRPFNQLDQLLFREGEEISWPEGVVKAWQEVFVPTLDDQVRLTARWTGKQERILPSEALKQARVKQHAGGQPDEQFLENVKVLKRYQTMSATA